MALCPGLRPKGVVRLLASVSNVRPPAGTPLFLMEAGVPESADYGIADQVPWSEHVTDYDRAHFDIYLRLLDAIAEGANEKEIIRIVLKIDPDREPERARNTFESHLKRARWMTETGYRDLLPS